MKLPETIELKNIDPEDISDVLLKIEKSFDFKFGNNELKDIKTFGELCDVIVKKLPCANVNDCTSQQGFYKLRNALAKTLQIDRGSISLDTDLHEIFPRRHRGRQISVLESELGLRLNLLRPKGWITNSLVLMLLGSVVSVFINWQAGIAGLVFSISGLIFSNKLGKELNQQKLGELAAKISRENYLAVRRNPSTFNRSEVVRTVTELFSKDLALDRSLLTRETTFD
jgi:hypothetical protein